MSDRFNRLAAALAGLFPGRGSVTTGATPPPPYMQPFQGLHDTPYNGGAALPPFQQPGTFANSVMPPVNPAPAPQPRPMPAPMPVAQPPQPMMADTSAPMSLEMQGMPAPMPVGQNQLERDYYAQLAQNPNGFDKGWLGRLFG